MEGKMETKSLHVMYMCLYMSMDAFVCMYVNICIHELCTYMCQYSVAPIYRGPRGPESAFAI